MRLTDVDPLLNRDYRRLQVRNLFYYFTFHCMWSCITNLIKNLEFGVIKIKTMSLARIVLKCMGFYRTVSSEQETQSNRSINLQLQFVLRIHCNRCISPSNMSVMLLLLGHKQCPLRSLPAIKANFRLSSAILCKRFYSSRVVPFSFRRI